MILIIILGIILTLVWFIFIFSVVSWLILLIDWNIDFNRLNPILKGLLLMLFIPATIFFTYVVSLYL